MVNRTALRMGIMNMINREQRAFSLVELSVVLVILGLLAGGILTGQSLIRAAQWRKTMVDVQNIRTAMSTFRDKYFALPGDMPNATAFWGAADGSTGNTTACYTSIGTGTATCNGDGNGNVGEIGAAVPPGVEIYRFWQHLNNAGIYPNALTGVPKTGTTKTYYWDTVVGTNVPASPIGDNIGYEVSYFASSLPSLENPSVLLMQPQTAILIAGCCLNSDPTRANLEGPAIIPSELWNLDIKIDDGQPKTGIVQVYTNAYGSCYLDNTHYDLSNSSKACEAIVGTGY